MSSLANRFYHWIRHPSAPVGLPAEGRARILDQPGEVEQAEVALQANYGAGRRLYEGFGGVLGVVTVYLEITPA